MTISSAVRLRILDLCENRAISVNKLCTLSGVTQSTVNNIVARPLTAAWIKRLDRFIQNSYPQ